MTTGPKSYPASDVQDRTAQPQFFDRRSQLVDGAVPRDLERRQFGNSHDHLSPDAAELGRAIDRYKLLNRRRFITYEEMLSVITSLGYKKQND